MQPMGHGSCLLCLSLYLFVSFCLSLLRLSKISDGSCFYLLLLPPSLLAAAVAVAVAASGLSVGLICESPFVICFLFLSLAAVSLSVSLSTLSLSVLSLSLCLSFFLSVSLSLSLSLSASCILFIDLIISILRCFVFSFCFLLFLHSPFYFIYFIYLFDSFSVYSFPCCLAFSRHMTAMTAGALAGICGLENIAGKP